MKSKWLLFSTLRVFLVFALILFAGAGLAQALEVITVPWIPGNPAIPHDTYNGVHTKFMAIARGGDGTYDYEWDFNGDGVYDYSNTTTNPYDLSATYTYPAQLADRLFIARIRVTSGSETRQPNTGSCSTSRPAWMSGSTAPSTTGSGICTRT
jgi:hypothetical protein